MAELIIAPRNAGVVDPARVVPPLPSEIPILPGQAKAAPKKTGRVGWKFVLVAIAAVALIRFYNWYSGYDGRQIQAVVTPAMWLHAKFGTVLPVTLRGGPRILKIGAAIVRWQGMTPSTCVTVYVYDRITGVMIFPSYDYCIAGLAYEIRYPVAR